MAIKQNSDYRLLVIDDSSADREIFKILLKKEGYQVDLAGNGREAFVMLYEKAYDLILCDYYMPEMDGEQFLLKLRKDPKLAHLVVILITSDESKEIKIRLLRSGANDFLHKGAAYEEIIARIGTHLNAKELFKAKSVLEFAGNYTSEISQPLASLTATIDLLSTKLNALNSSEERTELNKLVKNANDSIERVLELIEKIRKLEIDVNKNYMLKK